MSNNNFLISRYQFFINLIFYLLIYFNFIIKQLWIGANPKMQNFIILEVRLFLKNNK